MPIGSAVHARTFALCESLSFREWSGYYAVSAYETHHEHEYTAIRDTAALIDVSPLFKYSIEGQDAAALVDRVITRNAHALSVGQVCYTPWCDGHGKVIDDGTVTRVGERSFRWTAADPSLRWMTENGRGLNASVRDITEETAALALQGPTSAAILASVFSSDAPQGGVSGLKYFWMRRGVIAGIPVDVSRTGYTGDLGYEIWMPWSRAVDVWDALMTAGGPYGIRPAGMLALDVARVEAGLLLIDVDFQSSRKALVESQKYSPFEMGLDRLVQLDKGPFVGRDALIAERDHGSARRIVGLEIDWPAVEKLYGDLGMPPQIAQTTSRVAVPVYRGGRQIGRATSTTWSPVLKKLIALATLDRPHFAVNTQVEFEITVEAVRRRVPARVVRTPFFEPARKKAALAR